MADLPKDRLTPDQPPFIQCRLFWTYGVQEDVALSRDMESSLPASVAEQSISKWPILSTPTLVSTLSVVSSQEEAK